MFFKWWNLTHLAMNVGWIYWLISNKQKEQWWALGNTVTLSVFLQSRAFWAVETGAPSKHRLSGWGAVWPVECLPHESLGSIPARHQTGHCSASLWSQHFGGGDRKIGSSGSFLATIYKTIFSSRTNKHTLWGSRWLSSQRKVKSFLPSPKPHAYILDKALLISPRDYFIF